MYITDMHLDANYLKKRECFVNGAAEGEKNRKLHIGSMFSLKEYTTNLALHYYISVGRWIENV